LSYLPCLSDRRQAAEKQAEKVGRTVSLLKDALSSKEAELHKQHEELVRLRQAEDARERVESVEGKRLRALADSLVCKFGAHALALLLLLSSCDDVSLLVAAAIGVRPMEVAASGSGVLQGAVDAVAGAVVAVRDVCARASGFLGLAHEQLMPEASKVPDGLDARVAAFGPKGERMVELVAESVVSGSSTALAVLMGHGISIDDSLVKTIPDYSEELLERADKLALLLQKVVDAQVHPVVGEGGGQ
jgi:hypothetical protein